MPSPHTPGTPPELLELPPGPTLVPSVDPLVEVIGSVELEGPLVTGMLVAESVEPVEPVPVAETVPLPSVGPLSVALIDPWLDEPVPDSVAPTVLVPVPLIDAVIVSPPLSPHATSSTLTPQEIQP